MKYPRSSNTRPLDAEHLKALRQLIAREGLKPIAGALGMSVPTVAAAGAGAALRQANRLILEQRLDAQREPRE